MTTNAPNISGRRVKATNRITAANLSRLAKAVGRCGDIHGLTGDVCVTQPHGDEFEHMAIQIGGPRDGYVYARWGGRKANEANIIATAALPNV